jgi:hypothetical protein
MFSTRMQIARGELPADAMRGNETTNQTVGEGQDPPLRLDLPNAALNYNQK